MFIAFLVIIIASAIFWLVFFKLRLLRLTPGWGLIFGFFVLHLLLVFVIGLRFVTPNSSNATVVQRTIQLVPRLPEPTLVTEVLVEENVPVKKGQPLFQFDRRPYEYKVAQISAQLAEAKQNVKVLKADVDIATQKSVRTKVELGYELYQKGIFDKLAREGAVREEDIEKWATRVSTVQATNDEALAELKRANLKYASEIGGVNTTVASMEAQLRQAQYYLDNTTLTAPEDGRIINLQVRPGMVSGIFRIGGIAALIAEADRYVLATFYQQNLKYVRPGQRVEVALGLIRGKSSPGRSTASGGAMAWANICRATTFQNSSNRLPTPPKGSTRSRSSSMTRTSRSFPSVHKVRPRSTPAANTAPGPRCAGYRSARTLGQVGSIH